MSGRNTEEVVTFGIENLAIIETEGGLLKIEEILKNVTFDIEFLEVEQWSFQKEREYVW